MFAVEKRPFRLRWTHRVRRQRRTCCWTNSRGSCERWACVNILCKGYLSTCSPYPSSTSVVMGQRIDHLRRPHFDSESRSDIHGMALNSSSFSSQSCAREYSCLCCVRSIANSMPTEYVHNTKTVDVSRCQNTQTNIEKKKLQGKKTKNSDE